MYSARAGPRQLLSLHSKVCLTLKCNHFNTFISFYNYEGVKYVHIVRYEQFWDTEI